MNKDRVYGTIVLFLSGSLLSSCGPKTDETPPLRPLTVLPFATIEGAPPIRLVRDPVSGLLHVLKADGTIVKVSYSSAPTTQVDPVYGPADTGMAAPQGMAFGPDGTLYLVGNTTQ